MAVRSSSVLIFSLFLSSLLAAKWVASQDAVLDAGESESVYQVLEAVNPGVPWRSLFPDDLCAAGPHGVVCDSFDGDGGEAAEALHVTELSFGYVSDYSPNPPCVAESTLSPLLFSFKYLRKLFFYKCFGGKDTVSPPLIPAGFGSFLEELVFLENPSLAGPLGDFVGNFSRLRRLIVIGTGVSGEIPYGFGGLNDLEQISLARNRLEGGVPRSLGRLKKLRVLDLSFNWLEGKIPDSIGGLPKLSKMDLSHNRFDGKIPDSFKGLQRLELLDLGYNRFENVGIPLVLGEMPSLREVYLSGNNLGGQIPEIWEKLGGIFGLGLSGAGLIGNIPASMGLFLRNLCYLRLDNNSLEGTVPLELGFLESLGEINLENNRLRGRLPFTPQFVDRIGGKLKIAGNQDLCVDEGLTSAKNSSSLRQLKLCSNPHFPNAVLLYSGGSSINQAAAAASQFLIILGLLFVFFSLNYK